MIKPTDPTWGNAVQKVRELMYEYRRDGLTDKQFRDIVTCSCQNVYLKYITTLINEAAQ